VLAASVITRNTAPTSSLATEGRLTLLHFGYSELLKVQRKIQKSVERRFPNKFKYMIGSKSRLTKSQSRHTSREGYGDSYI
jgi:hypothetical protein